MTNTSWYRRSVWNYKGNREYTKSGYNAAKERFNLEDLDVDCSDRHYVITGCNSGIGLEIAREVAKRGGVLHMVCRNFESAKKARADLITNTGNDKIHLETLDLAKPREVAAWAKEFAATHEKIHVLINNAGCMVHEHKLDQDGIETNFAVNTLAVNIITMAFLPVLQRNEDARVVTVSSAGMLVVRLDPNDLMHESMEPFNGRLVYSQNKRQQVVMTLWYAQRYDKVHFSVMHPGWADTPAVRNSMPEFFEMMKDNLRSAGEGADTAVWLAISKAALNYPSGFFFQDRVPASTHLPLAWTKTTIEEENLFMQKLELLTQKVKGELPEDVAKPVNEGTVNNSHNLTNGVSSESTSSKVEEISATLSAVSVSEPEITKPLKEDSAVDMKTKEDQQDKGGDELVEQGKTVLDGKIATAESPVPESSQEEKPVVHETVVTKKESTEEQTSDATEQITAVSESKETVSPELTADKVKEEHALVEQGKTVTDGKIATAESSQEEKPVVHETVVTKKESTEEQSSHETEQITAVAESKEAVSPKLTTDKVKEELVKDLEPTENDIKLETSQTEISLGDDLPDKTDKTDEVSSKETVSSFETIQQSAESVVEHLIDVTAEQAASATS